MSTPHELAPALEPLRFLAGSWDVELSNPAFLPTLDAVVRRP
jgi:hypothetical protein